MATEPDPRDRPISKRERIAIRLFLFLIFMLAPWQYNHQYTPLIDELKKELE